MNRYLVVLAVMLIGGYYAHSQSESELIELANQKIVDADSLRSMWDVLWKRSDSMRIESMLVRIRSNVLRREANSLKKKAEKVRQDRLRREAEEERRRELARKEALFVGPRPLQGDNSPEVTKDPASTRPMSPTESRGDDAEILKEMQHREHLRKRHRLATSGKVKSGKTLSDSGTALVLRSEPDTGVASYYGKKFHGRKTANGETFNMYAHTCAHRWLPFGTKLRVTNLNNGKHVVVRVNDRGPFHHGRMIDISKQAAVDIGMIRSGTAKVAVEVVE